MMMRWNEQLHELPAVIATGLLIIMAMSAPSGAQETSTAPANGAVLSPPELPPVRISNAGPVATQDAGDDQETNNGEDATRPLSRFDLRMLYQRGGNSTDAISYVLRYDHPIELQRGWMLATRFDLPVHISNDHPSGEDVRDWQIGIGDLLTQFLLADLKDPGPNSAGIN
jgi:hypothetical protein